MRIRIAGEGDIPALTRLRRLWTEELTPTTPDDEFESTFTQWWLHERDRRIFWLAETEDADPIGFLNMVIFTRMPRPSQPPSTWGYVSNVYVRATHRNQGTGQDLLNAAITHADTHNYVRLVLSPTDRSIPFYNRAGFTPATSLLIRPGVPTE
ncbi:GNAT family N-acetyltransferase [Actinokineospora auranticolor]|uniref:L-amino acid N-acyltransferase YncA n=1 Tax=Actinokineospora auranticolor TaxID=155976 RepID=A0A2S6GVA6_9PSEU|nr:GNAT family N-acetyltransferase [Actinokineospora auranticolor]PPK69061.1 L-amino acid N-acyltransferase YncA [Actinokineospora auranticolor]